jgi:hypothetical protein
MKVNETIYVQICADYDDEGNHYYFKYCPCLFTYILYKSMAKLFIKYFQKYLMK